jgi:hypothetical protein
MPHRADNRRPFRLFGAAVEHDTSRRCGRTKTAVYSADLPERELLGRGVMEGEMDPGGPSPLKHAHRFVELEASVRYDRRDALETVSPAARLVCRQLSCQ